MNTLTYNLIDSKVVMTISVRRYNEVSHCRLFLMTDSFSLRNTFRRPWHLSNTVTSSQKARSKKLLSLVFMSHQVSSSDTKRSM